MGQIYWVGLPLIALGLIYIFSQNQKNFILVLGWLLIGPLSSSLVGQPHAIRSSLMLPPIVILIAAGIYYLTKMRGQRLKFFKVLLLILFIFQFPMFLYRFYLLSPNLNTYFWSYTSKKAADFASDNKDNYNHIILSANINDMEFAYPVYAKIEPGEVHFQNNNKTLIDEFKFLKYDNVYIGAIPSGRIKEIIDTLPGKVLYLGTVQDIGKLYKEEVTRDKDGSPLFVVSYKD